jgi:hypothetical protein
MPTALRFTGRKNRSSSLHSRFSRSASMCAYIRDCQLRLMVRSYLAQAA